MVKMLSYSLCFTSNNVKGIQSFEKRINIYEYRLLWVYFSTGDTLHHTG